MNGKQQKAMRNIAKDQYLEIVSSIINPRLDNMQKGLDQLLDRMKSQQQKIHAFLLMEVRSKITDELEKAEETRIAFVELMQEKLGIADLAAEIEARRPAIKARLNAEAVARAEKAATDARAAQSEGNPNQPDAGPRNADQPSPPDQETANV